MNIQKLFKTNNRLKVELRGLIIGLFTIDEFKEYSSQSSNHNKRINNTDGLSNILEVNKEEYILSDDEVVFLQNSNIIRNSIVVQNNSGTLIYDENIDYTNLKGSDIVYSTY